MRPSCRFTLTIHSIDISFALISYEASSENLSRTLRRPRLHATDGEVSMSYVFVADTSWQDTSSSRLFDLLIVLFKSKSSQYHGYIILVSRPGVQQHPPLPHSCLPQRTLLITESVRRSMGSSDGRPQDEQSPCNPLLWQMKNAGLVDQKASGSLLRQNLSLFKDLRRMGVLSDISILKSI